MSKKTFNKILVICYDEDYPELHRELVSLEIDVRKSKDFERGIIELITTIDIYAEELSLEGQSEINKIYENFLDSFEF